MTCWALLVMLDVGDVPVVPMWPSQTGEAADAGLPGPQPCRPAWAGCAWQRMNLLGPAAPVGGAQVEPIDLSPQH